MAAESDKPNPEQGPITKTEWAVFVYAVVVAVLLAASLIVGEKLP